MFDKLKKLLEGGVAQVNPFDGGKTFASVNRQVPTQGTPQQQQTARNISVATKFGPAAPKPPAITTPSVSPGRAILDDLRNAVKSTYNMAPASVKQRVDSVNVVRDIFDANTAADQQKRQAAGQAKMYYDQQIANGNKRPNQNIGTAVFGNTARLANTAKAAAGGVYGLGKIGASSIFGSDADYRRTVAGVNKTMDKDYSTRGGLLGAGTFFNSRAEAGSGNVADQTKRFVGAGVGTATEILPWTRGGKAVSAISAGAKTVPRAIIGNAVENAAYGAAGSAAQQQLMNGRIDPRQVVQDTAIAAGMGAAVPAGGALFNKLKGGGGKAAASQADNLLAKAQQQVDDIAKKRAAGVPESQLVADIALKDQAIKTAATARAASKEGGYLGLPSRAASPVRKEAEQVIESTKQHHADFNGRVETIAKNLGVEGRVGPPKKADRVAEKALADYNGDISKVRDIVRGTINLDDPNNLARHLDEINKNFEITRIKDKDLFTPGYSDVKVNVKLPNGREGEILLATPEMLFAKNKLGGHKLYVEARTTQDMDKLAGLNKEMNDLYAQAAFSTKRRLASSSEISDPSTSALAGEYGAPWGKTNPDTLSPSGLSTTTMSSTEKNLGLLNNANDSGFGILPPSTSSLPQNATIGNLTDEAYRATVKNGGVTIDLGGNQPSKGYAYSPFKDSEVVVPKEQFNEGVVAQYVDKFHSRLTEKGNHLGIWEDDGNIYLDVSQVGEPTPATIQAAEANGQLAVFDLENFNEIPTKLKGATDGQASLIPDNNSGQVPGTDQSGSLSRIAETQGSPSPQEVGLQATREGGFIALPGRKKEGTSRFAKRAETSPEISPELQAKVEPPTYTRTNNQEQVAASEALIKKGYKKAATDVTERLQAKLGTIDDQTISDAIAVVKKLDEKGGTANLQQATDIFEKVSEHLTKSGQTIQAASLLNNRTPQGLYYSAQRTLKKNGVEFTPQIQQELKALIDQVKATDANTYEGGLARFNVVDYVNKKMPSTRSNKMVQLWKAGLLTSPVTTAGNITANTAEQIYKRGYVDPLTTAVDAVFSVFTGKRSKSFTGRGVFSGAREGVGKGISYFKTGYDPRNPSQKFDVREIHYSDTKAGRAAESYTQGVFKLMGSQDQPFYYASLRNSLYDQAITEAKNKGLKSKAKMDYIKKFVTEPTKDALQLADKEARYDVFQNETALGKAAAKVKNGSALGDFIIPFSGVPSSIATRIVERTPIGIAKEIVTQMKGGKFDQRKMSQAIANGTSGIALIGAGKALYDAGNMTTSYPQDAKEIGRAHV